MKHIVLALAASTLLSGVPVYPVSAGNSTVEDAIKGRADLSRFYEALQATGVLAELDSNTSYAILAPTNEAFDRIDTRKYPCFIDPACREDLADVLRNHFVPGHHELDRESSMFSIDKRQLIVGKPNRGNISVDGNDVISESQLVGSVLYKLNGVIINDNELGRFRPAVASEYREAPPAPAR